MSLDVALRNAVSGLGVTQRNIEIVSRNVSNVQTPGYTRKIHQQQQLDPAVGGVIAGDPIRIVDSVLQTTLFRQGGTIANLQAQEDVLTRIEAISASPEDDASLVSFLGRLRDSFEALSLTPEQSPLQRQVVNRAEEFVDAVRRTSQTIQDERDRTQTDIAASITTVNDLLASIADLNVQISRATVTGRSVPDLNDQRDEAVRKLAEEFDVVQLQRENGSVAILTSNGLTLVDQTAARLDFTPERTQPSLFHVDGGTAGIGPITLSLNGSVIAGSDLTNSLRGGRLGAAISLRDEILPTFQAQLDEFSYRIASLFSEDPATGGAGLDLFVDSATNAAPVGVAAVAPGVATIDVLTSDRVGFASRLAVNPLVDADPSIVQSGSGAFATAGGPGDPSVVNRVIDNLFQAQTIAFDTRVQLVNGANSSRVLTLGFPLQATLNSLAREVVAAPADQRNRVTGLIESETAFQSTLSNRFNNQSGVNLDQEVTLLLSLQQTYGANARVISITGELFDELLSTVR